MPQPPWLPRLPIEFFLFNSFNCILDLASKPSPGCVQLDGHSAVDEANDARPVQHNLSERCTRSDVLVKKIHRWRTQLETTEINEATKVRLRD